MLFVPENKTLQEAPWPFKSGSIDLKIRCEIRIDLKKLSRGLSAYITTSTFNFSPRVLSFIMTGLSYFFEALLTRVKSSLIYRTVSGLLMAMAESTVLIVVAVDVFLGNMTLGDMIAYMAGFWKLMGGVNGLISLLPNYSRSYAYVQRLRDFESSGAADKCLPSQDVGVELCSISFDRDGQQVLSDLTLTVNSAERVLIVGNNGAGKTTLALILCNYLHASSGQVFKLPNLERVAAMIHPLNFVFETLRDHLREYLADPVSKIKTEEMLRDFGLLGKLDQDPQTFSEGERRKAYVVMTLSKDADLYIFDEPLSAIDEVSKPKVMEWVMNIPTDSMLIVIMHGDERFHSLFTRKLLLGPKYETRGKWTSAGSTLQK